MIIDVQMNAFGGGQIRKVDIGEIREIDAAIYPYDVQDAVYYWGQNDHQPQDLPSVSIGDTILYNGKRYAILPLGFEEIPLDYQVPVNDGGLWAYGITTETIEQFGVEIKNIQQGGGIQEIQPDKEIP